MLKLSERLSFFYHRNEKNIILDNYILGDAGIVRNLTKSSL